MDNPNKDNILFEQFLSYFKDFADNTSRIHMITLLNTEKLKTEQSFIPSAKISEWENYRKEKKGLINFEDNLEYSSYLRIKSIQFGEKSKS